MPRSSNSSLIFALLLPLFAWRIYRRFHRNVGRQPLRPGRLISGIVVFSLVTVLLLASFLNFPPMLEGLGAGLVVGLPLAWIGLNLTRFETDDTGRRFYTPNTYLGVGLTLLLAGRIVYRIGVLYFSDAPPGSVSPAVMQSPLTLMMIGVTASYYITYNTCVLLRKK